MKKWSLVPIFLLNAMSGQFLNAQDFWMQSWGPSPVRVKALSVTSDGHVLAGTTGGMGTGVGVLRSSDNGSTWVPVNSGLLDMNVTSLLVTRDGNLFAGTDAFWRTQGVSLYRSTDEGNSWIQADSGLADAVWVAALAEDSTGGLFCGPINGPRDVYHSTDDGALWVPTACPGDWSEALVVNRSGTLFSAGFMSVYRSSDAGATWIKADSGLQQPLPLITSLAVSPQGVLFAGMGYGGGVYRSTNDGGFWVRTPLNSGDVRALTVTPGGILFVGTWERGIFWSLDNGDTWHQDNSGLPGFRVWSLVGTQNGYVFAGTDSGGVYRSTQPVTLVNQQVSSLPQTHMLPQNYPNPFNPSTTIRYELPRTARVSLSVFDILGREVATLLNEEKSAGTYTVQWDASGVSSGVYFYSLKAGSFVQTRRMVVVK